MPSRFLTEARNRDVCARECELHLSVWNAFRRSAFLVAACTAIHKRPQNKMDHAMLDTSFVSPVVVLARMGFPLQIRGVMDILRYLDEQPSVLRDEAFHATYGVCRDALVNKASVSEARDLFCALARRRGVLVEEIWSGLDKAPALAAA